MIFSHTLITSFETCPREFQHRYVLKDLPREAPTPALKEGRDAHQAFEHRLKDRAPLPAPYASLESYCVSLDGHKPLVELSMAIDASGRPVDFWSDAAWLRGKADVALPAESAVILDWKTGKRREDPDELLTFGLLLQANFPLVKQVSGYYVWLKEGRIGQMHEVSATPERFSRMRERTGQITSALKVGFFPPKEGWKCSFCTLKACEFNRRRD